MLATIAPQTQSSPEFAELKDRLKATWMTGDYMTSSAVTWNRAPRTSMAGWASCPEPGCLTCLQRWQIALIAARSGARVTGCDIATNWLELARSRVAAEGLEAVFEEGDAEDGQFEVVTSLVGAMFTPQPDLVAA